LPPDRELTDAEMGPTLRPLIVEALKSEALDNRLVRYWMEWYVARHESLLESPELRNFVFNGNNVETQAVAAITTRNVAWCATRKQTC